MFVIVSKHNVIDMGSGSGVKWAVTVVDSLFHEVIGVLWGFLGGNRHVWLYGWG